MQNKETKPWFPVWIDKWLFGSTRIELKPDERAVFFDLVVLSKKDDGHIRANAGIPYLPTQLAGMLVVEIELLERTITRCIEVGKITRNPDGTLFVTSHPGYILSERQTRRINREMDKAAIMADEPATMAETAAPLYIEDMNIKIKKKEDKEKKAAPITYIHETTEFQGIEKKDLETWAAAYPAADIKAEIAKMIAWIEGDWPRRRKAKWRLFIQKWLARTQESGGTRAGSAPESKYVGRQTEKPKTASEVKYQEARERERRRLERLYGRDQDKINTGLAEFSHNYWGEK